MKMANMDLFKVGKAQRGRTVPTAISHQALLDKPKECRTAFRRCCMCRDAIRRLGRRFLERG